MKPWLAGLLAALGMARAAPPFGAATPVPPMAGVNAALVHAAQAILRIPKTRSSWTRYIQEGHDEHFIWTGQGDMVDQWNRLYGAGAGLADIAWDLEGDGDAFFVYHYKGKRVQFADLQSRENEIMVMLTMNRLLQPDSEIRLCVDSLHSSDWAWFALPPAAWRKLEQDFSAGAVAYRFMPLPDDLAAFDVAAFVCSEDAGRRSYNQG